MSAPPGAIDILITNVVSHFSMPMKIDLEKFAMNTDNCTFKNENNLHMHNSAPKCFVKLTKNGSVTIMGCTSEADSQLVAFSVRLRILETMGLEDDPTSLDNFRISNVTASSKFPFGILVDKMSNCYKEESTYEPELAPGLIWKMKEPKATIRIYSSGNINVMGASSENNIQDAVRNIYIFSKKFKCDPPLPQKRRRTARVNNKENTIKRKKI
uniref:TATA-box binding protein n=1 Tax=Panagrolaimus sp. ES5 TaxID=591445 RepID=A0AC34FIN4_9BILA